MTGYRLLLSPVLGMQFSTVVGAIGATFLVGTLIGHGIHWMMHRRWAGRFYRAHMQHHIVQYPPNRMLSRGKYRGSGKDSGWITFTVPIALLILPVLFILWRSGTPPWILLIIAAEFASLGYLHGYVHDAFHIHGHWLERFPWFHRLRKTHAVHHLAMSRNLGIFWFGWDRVFGTYRVFNKVTRGR